MRGTGADWSFAYGTRSPSLTSEFMFLLCSCSTCDPIRQSNKHILNQPPELCVELIKNMTNPTAKQWSWVARNLHLRTSLFLGSPSAATPRPQAMDAADIQAVRESLALLTAENSPLPLGCTVVHADGEGPLVGKKVISMIEWSWSGVHVSDEAFDWMLPMLQSRFLSGGKDSGQGAAGGSQDSGAVAKTKRKGTPATRGSGRLPPALAPKAGRGSKRSAGAVPVVPAAGTIRGLRHRSAAIKMEKGLDIMATAMLEEEARTSVVRPPFVIGHVKPFSAWPHGGVVVFAQFPFLLDQSWRLADKWMAYCRKVSVWGTGGRYEVMFSAKDAQGRAATKDEDPDGSLLATGDALQAVKDSAGAVGAAAAAVDASSATDAAAVRPSPTPSEADELLEDDSDIELGTEPSPVSVVGAASGQGSSATVVGRQVAVAAPVAIQLIDDSGKSASELLPPSPVGAVDSPTVVTPVVATSAAQVVGAPAVAGGAPVAGAVAVVDDAPVAGAVTVVGGAPAAGAIETGVVGATGAVAAGEVAAVAGGAVATPAAAVDGAAVAVAGGAPAAPGGTPAAAVAAAREARLSAVQRAVAEGVPGQFTPMPEPLQFRLGRALREGKLSGDIEEGEQVEWCVLARSPTPVFSMLCTFSSTLDLGRSQTLPCGTHRSNNYITGAYPARDPKDQELMEMEW